MSDFPAPCPDNAFLNSVTGQCETFTTGTPPPALAVRTTWGFWQWAMLLGGLAGVGMLAHAGYVRHRQGRQIFPKFKALDGYDWSKIAMADLAKQGFMKSSKIRTFTFAVEDPSGLPEDATYIEVHAKSGTEALKKAKERKPGRVLTFRHAR